MIEKGETQLDMVLIWPLTPAVLAYNWTYVIDIQVNDSTGLRSALNNISLPIQVNNYTQIGHIGITTGCDIVYIIFIN